MVGYKEQLVEAIQWTGKNEIDVYNFLENEHVESSIEVKLEGKNFIIDFSKGGLILKHPSDTEEGHNDRVPLGDYIIKNGDEFYHLKSMYFKNNYKKVYENIDEDHEYGKLYSTPLSIQSANSLILKANDWSDKEPYTQTLKIDSLSKYDSGELLLNSLTQEELDVCKDASISLIEQGNGYLIFKANNIKPNIDLHIYLLIYKFEEIVCKL